MPPELTTAIISALVTAIVTFAGILAILPRFLNARLDDWKQDQDVERKKQIQQIEATAQETKTQVAESIAIQNTVVRLADSIKIMAESSVAIAAEIAKTREHQNTLSERVTVNTEAVEQNTDLVDKLKTTILTLLTEGSQPLQAANQKLDDLTRSVVAVQGIAESNKGKLEQILNSITQLQVTLEITRKVAENKLEDIKHKTGELAPLVGSEAQ